MDTKDMSFMKRDKKQWFGKDRKTSLRQTNPNNRYFMRTIKKATNDFLSVHGESIKKEKPELYYSMINRPLPKKFKKADQIKPVEVKTVIPNPSIQNELSNYLKQRELERKVKAEEIKDVQKESIKLSFSESRKDPNRGMRFVNAFGPINTGRFGHSQSWKYKKEKKRSYYW